VIETKPGLDLRRDERVDQAIVECESRFVRLAAAARDDSRPRHRKPIGVDTENAHQANVLRIAVVVVAGDVTSVTVGDASGLPAIGVPNAWAAPVLGDGAFNLIAGRRNAPYKAVAGTGAARVHDKGPLGTGG
jgi:hypothetical protein